MAYSEWTPSAAAASTAVMVNNRRRAFRKMVMRDGLLISTGDQSAPAPYRVVVVDIAGLGIGLRCRQALPEGVIFSLSIPSKPEYDNSYVRIVRSRPCRGAEFEVGAEFC
jgi:hypothetical protein